MGYGEEAASAAGNAGGGFGGIIGGADAMQNAGLSTGTMDAIANASGGTSATSAVGGSINSIGPTIENANNLPQPSMWDSIKSNLREYSAGGDQDFGQAMDNFGFNMKTAGYLGKKIPTGGGAPQMGSLNIPQGQAAGSTTDPMEQFRKRRMAAYGGY